MSGIILKANELLTGHWEVRGSNKIDGVIKQLYEIPGSAHIYTNDVGWKREMENKLVNMHVHNFVDYDRVTELPAVLVMRSKDVQHTKFMFDHAPHGCGVLAVVDYKPESGRFNALSVHEGIVHGVMRKVGA